MKGIIAGAICIVLVAASAFFVYDTLEKNRYDNIPVFIQQEDVSAKEISDIRQSVSSPGAYYDVVQIMQLPDLPTGCECTSLTMVLRSLGLDADKTDISRNYLIKDELYRDENEKLFGPDYMEVFAGDPEDSASYGCFPPCIVKTANKYLSEKNSSGYTAKDISGTDFYSLFSYIENGLPVIIWSTQGLKIPKFQTSWETPDGKEITWPTNEHCIVLSGYSYNDNTVRVNDPLDGEQILSMEKVKKCYDLMGQNAVIISKE